ncbi:XIAP-associated factor 1 [Fundulus diaphanus]
MENTEPTRTCGACHKKVAEANFALHESHCQRFLCLCPDCDEAVPRDQLSQHREEQHAQVKCSKCNKKMERCHLADHEAEECPDRLEKCQFCELEVPWKQLQEHCVVCGSRTELCRDCGSYVKLSDQPQHGLTCSAADEEDSPQHASSAPDTSDDVPKSAQSALHVRNIAENIVSCKTCRTSFLAERMDRHKLECYGESQLVYREVDPMEDKLEDEDDFSEQQNQDQLSSAYKATSLSYTGRLAPWGSGGDPDQISTCPHCHLALPFPTLKWHEAKCRIHMVLKGRDG